MASWYVQFGRILSRTFISQFRQPTNFITRFFSILFFAVFTIILFEEEAEEPEAVIQNTQGVVFTNVVNLVFAYVYATLNVFNFERPVFLKERANVTYSTSAFFWARSLASLPLDLFLPVLYFAIVYWAVPLQEDAGVFFLTILIGEGVAWMSGSYGLLLSSLFKDANIPLALTPSDHSLHAGRRLLCPPGQCARRVQAGRVPVHVQVRLPGQPRGAVQQRGIPIPGRANPGGSCLQFRCKCFAI